MGCNSPKLSVYQKYLGTLKVYRFLGNLPNFLSQNLARNLYFPNATPGLRTTALGKVLSSVDYSLLLSCTVISHLLAYFTLPPSCMYYETSVLLVSEKLEEMSGFVD